MIRASKFLEKTAWYDIFFNTYIQRGRMHKAVTVEDGVEGQVSVRGAMEYYSELITDYEKLIRSLEISAGATIQGLDQGGGATARFLDRNETSFMTYLVRVDVKKQPSAALKYQFNWTDPENPHETYGDRFISDFVTGGALFGRVSIFTTNSDEKQEIEQSAEVAFSAYGAQVQVTQEIKASMEKIHKHSEVKIRMLYVGEFPESVSEVDDPSSGLLQLKAFADKFLVKAKEHKEKRYAVLDEYTNIPGFDPRKHFKPFDYSVATNRSWSVAIDFTEYLSIQTALRAIAENHYVHGRRSKESLDDEASNVVAGYKDWVAKVIANPGHAETRPPYPSPHDFHLKVLDSLKKVTYFGRRLRVKDNLYTHYIDEKPGDKPLFSFQAFNFGEVAGSDRILFGKKTHALDYVCVMGRRMPAGYDKMSELWVFPKEVTGMFDNRVDVHSLFELGTIELDMSKQGHEDLLFSFYVKKVD
ncbi:hypothetical protein H634G_05415 [Metarhizium anisopliae BRIP 53293]|uniref:MACPF domain-containing protein n=1 Tax=Metarhizium anisopliae BRIP 53293 TaxID=1291518 RepID=A0A0D9P2Y5_METAN|nr:hypothetical protein H634G_05415 [Metarhizium anisopliae BRIP 53293]KJK86903.1 hypothetical protein H633G_09242 [Metarhizium anisopliae BRIP 53284]